MSIRALARAALLVLAGAALAFAGAAHALRYDADVEAAQERLAAEGFDPGPIDGLIGRRTRAALERFQRARELKITGRLDEPTQRALGMGAAPAPAPVPAPVAETAPAPEPQSGSPPASTSPAPLPASAPPLEPEPEPEIAIATRAPAPRPAGSPRRLDYASLGWRRPAGGPDVLDRLEQSGENFEMKLETEIFVVPGPESVYLVLPDERIPGFDCDPGAGSVSMEFVFDQEGPISFENLAGPGLCRIGFSIVIAVGRTLTMRRSDWGENQVIAPGSVRVGPDALVYE